MFGNRFTNLQNCERLDHFSHFFLDTYGAVLPEMCNDDLFLMSYDFLILICILAQSRCWHFRSAVEDSMV